MARERSGYSIWATTMEDIPVGIPEFLELCREVGAEPWIVAPTAMSEDEARKLAEYLAGGAETPGGALRVAGGRREPWTRAFRTIHIELGNETWNGIFAGETMEDAAAYGRRADRVFSGVSRRGGSGCGTVRSGCGDSCRDAGEESSAAGGGEAGQFAGHCALSDAQRYRVGE